jgi:UPF0755 protein
MFNFDFRFRAREMGLTMDDVVIIASMIEREVRVPAERPIVAQVIYNRLNLPMRLQIDATVLYALDMHVDRLLYADLETISPYNTYVVDGLPIGPISNPGFDSLRAALYPAEDVSYLFYVLMDRNTGEHFFTNTYEEHLRAVDRFRNEHN